MRSDEVQRVTQETAVKASLTLDGTGRREIATGIAMLDHLLGQFVFHSGCDLALEARSLDRIAHHLIEDVALTLGAALAGALGERRGIARFGEATIPMDDALARAAVDLAGRPFARVQLGVTVERIEDVEAAMLTHFLRSLASSARLTLHVETLAGEDPHHCVEAAFKALARAVRAAWTAVPGDAAIASTKGVL